MRIFSADEVLRGLPMADCIAAMRAAILGLAEGRSVQPLRTMTRLPDGNILGFMPAYLGAGDYFGAKIATAFFTNQGTGYPSHMGYVMLMEAKHGAVVALADATAVTRLRTGAVSGLATDLLARKDARTLAIIGAGAQGRSHLEAVACVRKLREARVFDVDTSRAEAFAREESGRYGVPVRACGSVRAACEGADIVCTVTTCKTPVLSLSDVAAGAHVNAVGAYTPTAREIASDLVAASRLFADDRAAMLNEGGEYLLCKQEGLIDETHIAGDLGELLLGRAQGRQTDAQITLFSAHGLAVEDVACVRALNAAVSD